MNKLLSLFTGYGVELEYMIVAKDSMHILPICDQLLHQLAGSPSNTYSLDKIALSNELVMHVVEFKTNGPAPRFSGLDQDFKSSIQSINQLLATLGAQLLPSGAHPWMDPEQETRIWPHENNEIYRAYNRIFDCRGHGWSNLQSTHLNLPFSNDEEFAKLHTAIRLILPLIPALSASTPILAQRFSGFMDTRLEYYRTNQQAIPIISGDIIPEQIFSQQEYHDKILTKIYQAIAPFDPHQLLQEEWLNSRGAIARFDRHAIEIRLIDIQECPQADIAILALITAVLKDLVAEKWQSFAKQSVWHPQALLAILLDTIKDGQQAIITNPHYLQLFGYPKHQNGSALALWQHLLHTTSTDLSYHLPALEHILTQGNLAQRIMKALNHPAPAEPISLVELQKVYQQLAICLNHNTLYTPP